MTNKQYIEFTNKIYTRLAHEAVKYGRQNMPTPKIPNKFQADMIYDSIKAKMKAESAMTGRKNTNYMRAMVNRWFHTDTSYGISKKEYMATKSANIDRLVDNYALSRELAQKIVDVVPPTVSDIKYGRNRTKEFWDEVSAYQKLLKREGQSWRDIEHIIGELYFGKVY